MRHPAALGRGAWRLALVLSLSGWAFPAFAAPTEAEVKAAYLYKLASFVRWPDGGAGAFRICVAGRSDIGIGEDRAVVPGADASRTTRGRALPTGRAERRDLDSVEGPSGELADHVRVGRVRADPTGLAQHRRRGGLPLGAGVRRTGLQRERLHVRRIGTSPASGHRV